ncbi:MAG: TolC family protein, partial [Myxococcota bacterium]|nr:TolC family protein [Myxococcota bacterium]
RARGALAVAQAAVSAAELQAELIDAMVRAGTTAQVDAIRVQAQVAAARVAAIRAEAGVRISEMAVRTIMHLEPGAQVAIAEDLLDPLPAIGGTRAGLITAALDRRAEMLAIRQAIYARGRQVDAAEGSRWPHLIVAGNFSYANPNQRIFPQTQQFRETWDLSVLLTWSPNDFFTGEFQAAEARAMQSQAETDLRTLQDGITMQVTQAYENLRASQAAIEAARIGVEAADETLRVRHEQYRAGATVVTELVLAVNERARAQLDLIGAALDARIAYTQLQRAIGTDPAYERAE